MGTTAKPLRIALASMGAEEFAMLRATCQAAGHTPVAYAYSRSMRSHRHRRHRDLDLSRTVGTR